MSKKPKIISVSIQIEVEVKDYKSHKVVSILSDLDDIAEKVHKAIFDPK